MPENRSRRNNPRVDGVMEEKGETWEMCRDNVKEILTENLGTEKSMNIDRALRVKGKIHCEIFLSAYFMN